MKLILKVVRALKGLKAEEEKQQKSFKYLPILKRGKHMELP